ncbi:MAG TPA: hypothetical protein DER01_01115, partial [Phycisphaerales bacterium]|nr:hypothetical protein [Phycisphaerales bacterium]
MGVMNQPLNFEDKRLAFLGDSITDGHTLILLMEQSLQVAGIIPPICTNVAVCGNCASDMLKRLERDVLGFAPDYCTLSVGVNDANHQVSVSDYQQQVTQLLDQLDQAGIQVILLTPTPNTSSKAVTSTPLVNAYVDFLNQIAAKRQLRIAQVNDAFTKAIADQIGVLTGDGIHVDFAGYRIMARCVLDAMGYAHVPVVEQLKLQPMPGLIDHWHIRAVSH